MPSRKTDVDSTHSNLSGVAGIIESFFRTFKDLFHIALIIPLYFLGFIIAGLATTPGLWLLREVFILSKEWPLFVRLFSLGASAAAAYFMYGLSLLLILPTVNSLLRLRLRAWRGQYYSLASIPWYIHNALTYVMRFTFLEFITPTPMNIYFYRAMGMKIGRGTVINTTAISDPSLIRMGEKVTIGGSVTIVGHYGQGGYLILSPVEIGTRATIGLKCSIMGGANIGKEARVLPHSVVMPKTIIPDGEIWAGVPAVKVGEISKSKMAQLKAAS